MQYDKPVKHELGWADDHVRSERAIVRHWHLVMLAYTFSLLMGAAPATVPGPTAVPPPSPMQVPATGGGTIRTDVRQRARGACGPGRDLTLGTEFALPLGAAVALLEALVEQRPTARTTGRAPRPPRQRPPA